VKACARVAVSLVTAAVVACSRTHEASPNAAAPPPSWPTLADEAAARGLVFPRDAGGCGRRWFPETMAGGAALFDADGDGDLDALIVGATPLPGCTRAVAGSQLYRNDGRGNFAPWGAGWPADGLGYGMGVAVGDVDGDGDRDLFLAGFGGSRLLRNDGGRFVDATAAARIADAGFASSAAFADVDGDGDLDLYVAHYVAYACDDSHVCKGRDGAAEFCEPDSFPAEPDRLWRNLGDGTFEEATAAAGLVVAEPGRGLGVVFLDSDQDGDQDLFVANDRSPNLFFVNDGRGRFTEEGFASGAAFGSDGRVRAGMGCDAGDFDGDGREDLVVVNFSNEPATLLRNGGDGTFEDVAARTGVGVATTAPLSFGAGFLDFDLDGRLDLFLANGHVLDTIERHGLGQNYAQRATLLLQEQDGGFRPADGARHPALATPHVGRAAAFGDVDDDGDTDIVVAHPNETPELLLTQGAPTRRWIGFTLRGPRGNPDAYGARVEVAAGGRTLVRVARAAKSYLASSDPRVVVGLGDFSGPVDVVIHWPDGKTTRHPGLADGRYHALAEP
jgi:hypothetical protein